jgi:Tfp pilus assembly protein PilZ
MNDTRERREYPRYNKQFRAHYITAECTRGGDECTIINASLKGVGVVFHSTEPLKVGTTIILEICVPGQPELYSVKGTLKWVRKRTHDSIGGIELAELFDALQREDDTVDGENQREEGRLHIRFSTNLNARYFVKELGKQWGKCTVFDVSRKGMGITFHTAETIQVGSTINLEITVPSELEPMIVKGTLKWIKQENNEYSGGIELIEVLDEITSLIIMLQG